MAHFVNELNELQINIMQFVKMWVNTEKVPVPKKIIVTHMEERNVKDYTVLNALRTLVKMGYIRQGYNKKNYVMTRNI